MGAFSPNPGCRLSRCSRVSGTGGQWSLDSSQPNAEQRAKPVPGQDSAEQGHRGIYLLPWVRACPGTLSPHLLLQPVLLGCSSGSRCCSITLGAALGMAGAWTGVPGHRWCGWGSDSRESISHPSFPARKGYTELHLRLFHLGRILPQEETGSRDWGPLGVSQLLVPSMGSPSVRTDPHGAGAVSGLPRRLRFKKLLQLRRLRFRVICAETGSCSPFCLHPAPKQHGGCWKPSSCWVPAAAAMTEPPLLPCGEQICNSCSQKSKKTGWRAVGRCPFLQLLALPCRDARGAEQTPANGA